MDDKKDKRIAEEFKQLMEKLIKKYDLVKISEGIYKARKPLKLCKM